MSAQQYQQGQRQKGPEIHLASRELTTRMQMDTLLQTIGVTTSALGHFWDLFSRVPEESEARESAKNLMAEGVIAVENTLRETCERIETILKDNRRWSTEFQDKIEREYDAAYKLQCEVLNAQRAGAEEVLAPHFRYRPTLFRLVDGSWCAFLGDINHMDQGIVGVGNTPQLAIEAFDDAFCGISNPEVIAWCKAREKNLEAGINDEAPFPKTETQEQNNETPLDTDGNGKTEDPSEGKDTSDEGGEGTEPQP